MKTVKNRLNKIIFLLSIFLCFSICFSHAKAEEHKTTGAVDEKKSVEQIFQPEEFFDGEETIVISIINFGRKNPFKPYAKANGISIKNKGEIIKLDEIPYPPAFDAQTSPEITELMSSRVNGILYDPNAKSVAIVNIKGAEHMLHKGDIVQGIMVDSISEKHVTLKYGDNTYTVGIGDVIEGDVHHDPVQRDQSSFAGSDYDLPDLNLEEYIQE